MTAKDLLLRFPEIPADLASEPVFMRYAATFGEHLRIARAPSPCSQAHDAANHRYLKLIGPLAFYGLGLATRERVLSDLQKLLDRHDQDPQGFSGSLVPEGTAADELRPPGCG